MNGLFESRRFWLAVGGVVTVLAEQFGLPLTEDQVQMIITVIATWILGDSLRKTEPKSLN